jgi:hypothetical protein
MNTGYPLFLPVFNSFCRKCIADWGVLEVKKQFEALHALVNLMVVVPENLPEAAQSQALAEIDRSLINTFVQLRHDAKTARLYLTTNGTC